jgi:transglutaminase-like putative cysteine protease
MSERWHFKEGWGVLLLSLALVVVTGLAVANTGWAEGLGVIPPVSLGAFLIGFMITKSLLPGWLGHLFSLTIGFGWSFRLVTTLFPYYYTWKDRWAWLWWRAYQWGYKLFTGGISYDNLIFVFQMAFIAWIVGYLTVWFVFRAHKEWHAIIPGGVLLLVNLYYAPQDITIYFLAYLVLAFLFVIRFNLFTQQQTWRQERVHFNADEVNFDFLRSGALFTLIIVALAWITPSAIMSQSAEYLQVIRGPWHDVQVEWNRLFASLNYRASASADFYGKAMALGGSRTLGQVPVLEVAAPHGIHYYWRAVAFDEFTGREWRNNDDTFVPFGGENNQPFPIATYQGRQLISETVTILQPGTSVLVMAEQPTWVDLPTRASLSYVDPTAKPPLVETISFAQSRVFFEPGDHYVVSSLVTTATIPQLEQAGDSYPAWVKTRYLQLPSTIPERVKQLAQTLTISYSNPYDKANAIQNYLRRAITYNEKISAPPADRDPVDYVLFDLKEGYCDYYATAMAVMLRSLDIPSRVVSGYAQGEYDMEKDSYVVSQKDAHSWVEVFFPSYGWIEFEPTAAQPVIERAGAPSDESWRNEDLPQDRTDIPGRPNDLPEDLYDVPRDDMSGGFLPWMGTNLNQPSPWIWVGLVSAAAAGAAVWVVRNRRAVPMSEVEAIYANMLRLAEWAGAHIAPWQTPHEHAAALSQVLPDGEPPAQCIARVYSCERYGHCAPDLRDRSDAHYAWKALHPQLRRAVLRRWVGRSSHQ